MMFDFECLIFDGADNFEAIHPRSKTKHPKSVKEFIPFSTKVLHLKKK